MEQEVVLMRFVHRKRAGRIAHPMWWNTVPFVTKLGKRERAELRRARDEAKAQLSAGTPCTERDTVHGVGETQPMMKA